VVLTGRITEDRAGNVSISTLSTLFPTNSQALLRFFCFLSILLSFEPTLFPKLQVYFADFPYPLSAI